MKKNKGMGYWSGCIAGFVFAMAMITAGWQAGCAPKQATKVIDPGPGIQLIGEGIDTSANQLQKTTRNIEGAANDGIQRTPAETKPILDPLWGTILINVETQKQIEHDLRAQVGATKAAEGEVAKLRKSAEANEKLVQDRDKTIVELKANNSKWFMKNLYLLALLGVCGGAASVVMFFTGNKIGVSMGIGSAALTAIALFVAQTMQYAIFVVGGVVVVCAIVASVFLWKNRRMISDLFGKKAAAEKVAEEAQVETARYHKALVQTVRSDELSKRLGTLRNLHGNDLPDRLATLAQDPETLGILSKIKEEVASTHNLPEVPATGEGLYFEEVGEESTQVLSAAPRRAFRLKSIAIPGQ